MQTLSTSDAGVYPLDIALDREASVDRLKPLRWPVRLFATLLWCLPVVGTTSLACDTSCGEKGQDPILYTEGIVTDAGDGTVVYSTTTFDDVWLHFPSERRFRLRHELGSTNYTPLAFVALTELPASAEGSGEFSQAAGNEVVFEQLSEDELVVRNATCAEFYLLVRLESTTASGS